MKRAIAILSTAGLLIPLALAQEKDVLLQAMRDELERASMLRVASLDPPYFVEYGVEDASIVNISASLGALIRQSHSQVRIPDVHVRVGSPAFDNTDHVYSEYYSGTRYDPSSLPVDNNYNLIRQIFWLATDREFKGAEESISRKRSALKNVTQTDQLPDFSKAPPVQSILPVKRVNLNENAWRDRIVKLSGIFGAYPKIFSSGIEFESIQSTDYIVNTEGTVIRNPDNMNFLRVRGFTQAPDGTSLRDAEVFQAAELEGLPSELELQRNITALANELTGLSAAPMGDAYDGPVLFEPRAAAQLFAQVLGDNLKIGRKPVGEGRRVQYQPSELENKVGARILPEWMDVVDDPTQTEWRGQGLFGHYNLDDQGVKAQPVSLIEKGVLKSFLLTRTPVLKGFETSNGHARLHGNFGDAAPGIGNLFVRTSQPITAAELKTKFVDMLKQRNKPYGLLVRKLDFPSAMTLEELRTVFSAMSQSGGGTRPVAPPLLVYRVYPDGREELVRGLRFRGVSTRSFRDIAAASDETYVFNFLDNTVPFALMGAGQYISSASVVAPGLLFEEMEMEPAQEDRPKLPIVPPPALGPTGF